MGTTCCCVKEHVTTILDQKGGSSPTIPVAASNTDEDTLPYDGYNVGEGCPSDAAAAGNGFYEESEEEEESEEAEEDEAEDAEEIGQAEEVQDTSKNLGLVAAEERLGDDPGRPPPKEFQVEIVKANGDLLGLELDCLDTKHGRVMDIQGGAVEKYNDTVAKDLQVLPDDFVVGVNGAQGNVNKMLRQLREATCVTLTLRRTTPFSVSLGVLPDSSILLTFKSARGGTSLMIADMHRLYQQWNAAHPELPISLHDRVVEVCGERAPSAMVGKLQSGEPIELLIQSPLR